MNLPARTIVVSRAMHPELVARCQALVEPLGVPFIPIYAESRADGYFERILPLDADFAISLDEDAFVGRCDHLAELVNHFANSDYAFAGMPDNKSWYRIFAEYAPNAFFMLLNMARLRAAGSFLDLHNLGLRIVKATKLEVYEPYYHYFLGAIAKKCKFLPLPIRECSLPRVYEGKMDFGYGPMTIVQDLQQRDILLHVWYARNYGYDADSTARVDDAHSAVLEWRACGELKLPPFPA